MEKCTSTIDYPMFSKKTFKSLHLKKVHQSFPYLKEVSEGLFGEKAILEAKFILNLINQLMQMMTIRALMIKPKNLQTLSRALPMSIVHSVLQALIILFTNLQP